jgi:predicted Zn-dependent protease
VSPNRRELLGALGTASASTLLWALGCSGPARRPSAPARPRGEVRTWLRDAVARLAAVFPHVHVLAVSRQRTSAAVDVLGTGVARARRDGAVLAVRDPQGRWREQATSELTQAGIDAAVRALAGAASRRASLSLGAPPPPPAEPAALDDRALSARCEQITQLDGKLNSRIVYAAALVDVDDARVWSISPSHDREQRLVRVRKQALRAAWNGTRPVTTLAERGWLGGVDDQELSREEVERATEDALRLMTPGAFEDGDRVVLLDPAVAASLVDAAARALWTSAAARRPEVRRRAAPGGAGGPGGPGALPAFLTITDDPTAPGAYGGFQFDDEGVPAAPVILVDSGRPAGVLADRAGAAAAGGAGGRGLRPGHVGPVEPAPSHLQLAAGPFDHAELRDEGLILEGALGATVDPGTGRVVVGSARARALKGGEPTGRVYADVELTGELSTLLGAVSGLGKDVLAVPYRDERSGEPCWRSVLAPHVRTRGLVRARRRRA